MEVFKLDIQYKIDLKDAVIYHIYVYNVLERDLAKICKYIFVHVAGVREIAIRMENVNSEGVINEPVH